MSEEQGRRNRRRRGRRGRGGGGQPQGQPQQTSPDAGPPGPPGPATTPSSMNNVDARPPKTDGRGPRRDTRGQPRRDDSQSSGSRTHRPPSSGDRPRGDRGPRRDGGGGYDRNRRPSNDRDRDGGSRIFEPPVPQDPVSIELGAKFKESQIAVRDAKKALDKRRAEFDDEPEWMLEQLATAERTFEEAATAWTEHLETTGRKVVRR